MQVTPTISAVVGTTLSVVLLAISVVSGNPLAFAWSGALLLGIAWSRMQTRANLVRARAEGFEMLWQDADRNASCRRFDSLTISAELRNRSDRLLVLERVTALAPPELSVHLDADSGLLPPHSTLIVTLVIRPLRVGYHGLQGLTVMVRDENAAFEAQLTFANPVLIESLPRLLPFSRVHLLGGLGRHRAAAARTKPITGDAIELRELREFQRSDPLRKIAWKASAKRGVLLVRDDEKEQHSLVYYILDASVELWAGTMGASALDGQIDAIATAIVASLRRGERVGLVVVASRVLAKLPPLMGKAHERKVLALLAQQTTTRDHDRSGLDEQDVAAVILEHLRPVDPLATKRLTTADLDGVCRLAQRYLSRAPQPCPPEPAALATREQILRNYLAAFGLPSYPRTTPDRDKTDRELIDTMRELLAHRPDRIAIYSPWPSPKLVEGLRGLHRRLRKARIDIEWCPADVMAGRPNPANQAEQALEQSAQWHGTALRDKGNLALRKLGIRAMPPPIGRISTAQPNE